MLSKLDKQNKEFLKFYIFKGQKKVKLSILRVPSGVQQVKDLVHVSGGTGSIPSPLWWLKVWH